ncbi:uncharacterized protein LOC107981274 [Nasonia vitripennis]|uniref:Double jelly roll-like domain-containing protein n=1 Tax=Nasonia vitripennis TaxID=7425 RepID=A0A7M7IV04_NASVI|nr:uncharacterized protein LOC107981274 [Nasonia vitripennis]
MSKSHQSSANVKNANTAKDSVSKKPRLKSWWKITCIFFCCQNGRNSHYEIHAHQPYNVSSYNNSDEIRISVQHQDLCLLPSASSLYVCGRLTKADGTLVKNTKFVNNAVCHMFEEIRYVIRVSINPSRSLIIHNAGWLDVEEKENLINSEGYFDISIPLSMFICFTEDYCKVVVNVKHEIILITSRNDLNSVIQTPTKVATATTAAEYEDFKIELMKIEWLMPYVVLSNQHKIRMLSHIQKGKSIDMSFRSWELYEYPLLPRHVWTGKTSNQLEKPRFAILGFQTNRKEVKEINASRFDHCNISNVKLFLNSQYYPYGKLNLDIQRNQYVMFCDMYANFQHAYYDKSIEPMLKK